MNIGCKINRDSVWMDPKGNSSWMILTLWSVDPTLTWWLVLPGAFLSGPAEHPHTRTLSPPPVIWRNLCSSKFATSHQFGWCFKAESHETGVGPEWINLKLIWFWKTPSGYVWERQLDRYINKSVFIVPDVVSKNEEMAFKKVSYGEFWYNDIQPLRITAIII